MVDVIELIRQRRSVRTFDGNGLSAEDAKKILDFAEKVQDPYDIPITWRILGAKAKGLSSPVIVGTDCYMAGKMQPVAHAEEAFGYAFEKVVLFAQSLGVGTTWIAGTMDRAAFERAMELTDGEVMPCVSPLGYPAKKMSVREAMMRKGVKADSRMAFGELFFDGSFGTPLTEERTAELGAALQTEAKAGALRDVAVNKGALRDALEAVRLAPSAVNKQPWRTVVCGSKVHFYEKRSKGYVSQTGWDLQKVDMGIALCHFELAAQQGGLATSFEICDPGLATPEGTIYIASFSIGDGSPC